MKEVIIKTSIAMLALLSPIHSILIATGILIMLDLVTGICRAIKAKEKISSGVMRRTVTKFAVFNTAIITGFIMEQYLMAGIPVTKLISSVIAMVEGKSILENLDEIYGESVFKKLLKKLGSDNDKGN